MTSQPKISVIIPAYNCERTIAQALRAVLAQQGVGEFEVIVVDDGSTDGTADKVRSFSSVKYIRQENAGPATARNKGAKEASGDVLFYTDSDCQPHHDWISTMIPYLSEPKVAAIGGSYGISNPENFVAVCVHKEILFRHHVLMPKYPKAFGSYNFCVRRKVLEELGGFDEGYHCASGEDNNLSYKILAAGYRIYFERASKVDHYHPSRLKKYFYEQFRHGFWRVRMYIQHPKMSTGDDYTFWKDAIEMPATFLVLVGLAGIFLKRELFVYAGLISLTGLILLELFYGLRIMKDFKKGLFLSMIMFLRAFARMFGFACGAVNFPFSRNKKTA